MLNIIIRDESPQDYNGITRITMAAFTGHPYSRNTEQFIVEKLRETKKLSVSLVAVGNEEVVGHVAFSPVTINGKFCNWYGVGPLSVKPALWKQGIGSALMRTGMEKIKTLHGEGCVLVGDPLYYIRFGYHTSDKLTFAHAPKENFLILPFSEKEISGEVEFDEAFAAGL